MRARSRAETGDRSVATQHRSRGRAGCARVSGDEPGAKGIWSAVARMGIRRRARAAKWTPHAGRVGAVAGTVDQDLPLAASRIGAAAFAKPQAERLRFQTVQKPAHREVHLIRLF